MNRFEKELEQQRHGMQTAELAGEEYHEHGDDENIVPFDEVDRAIIAFVASKREDSPNQTQIVEEIQKNHADLIGTSRVSLLKRLEALVKYKVLSGRPDPKNRQTKRYYVNKESLLLYLHNYFDSFESALISLVKAFVEKNGGPVTGQKPEEILFFTVIFELYQHVIGIAMTAATFSWRKLTNDPVLLNRLNKTLFAKLIRLQENLSKQLEEAGVDLYRTYISSSWRMLPEVIDEGITVAQKYDLPNNALSRVFDLAWSIGAPVAKYARAKFEGDAPAEGIGEFADENDARIDKWNSSRGWTKAYLYWKERTEKQQK
jgi:hypothetical protein